MSAYTLYATKGSGNCYKLHLLMRQLAIPYDCQMVDVLKGETRQPPYLAVNPNGTVPFLRCPDDRAIAESNAMLWYLAHGSHLAPQDAYQQAMTVQWMIIEQTQLEPHISPARFFTILAPERGDTMKEQIAVWRQKGVEGLKRLDTHLRAHRFIVGDSYSIADIAVFGYTHVAHEGGFDMGAFPAVTDWIGRVEQTPDYVAMSEL